MAVTNSQEDVKISSIGRHLPCTNYNLYKHIESGNFAEAGKIIEQISKFEKIKKSDLKSFVSLVLKYYILTDNHNADSFYIKNKNNLMKRDILFYCKYLYHINFDKSLNNFK